MHNLIKYLHCNKLGGETLNIIYIVDTVQAYSGSLLMCIRQKRLQSCTLSWQHTYTQTQCMSL